MNLRGEGGREFDFPDEDEFFEEDYSEEQERLEEAQELLYEGWEALSESSGDPEEDLERAEAFFRRALELDPQLADAYNGLAEIAVERGDLEEAEELYWTAYRLAKAELGTEEPEAFHWWRQHETRPYMRAREGLGFTYWEEGRYDEALAEFEALLRLNPNDNQGVRYLIPALYQLKGELDKALEVYEEFEERYPGDPGEPHFLFNWGLALYAVGRLEEAVAKLRQGIFQNLYIAPLLLGRDVHQYPFQHWTETAEPDYAVSYLHWFGELWEAEPGALRFLERLWEDPELRADIRQYIRLSRELDATEAKARRAQLINARRELARRAPSQELIARVLG